MLKFISYWISLVSSSLNHYLSGGFAGPYSFQEALRGHLRWDRRGKTPQVKPQEQFLDSLFAFKQNKLSPVIQERGEVLATSLFHDINEFQAQRTWEYP